MSGHTTMHLNGPLAVEIFEGALFVEEDSGNRLWIHLTPEIVTQIRAALDAYSPVEEVAETIAQIELARFRWQQQQRERTT